MLKTMFKDISHFYLSQNHINELLDRDSRELIYHHEEFLVYKKHIPQAAFCLLDGEIIARKYKKHEMYVPKNYLICFEECLENRRLNYDLIVSPKSKIIVIPKSILKFHEVNQILSA